MIIENSGLCGWGDCMGVIYYKQNKSILEPCISWENLQLVYVSFNDEKENMTPTAVHCHEHNLELQYICGGRGSIRIGRRLYEVEQGDVLVYNQGKLHDESADPKEGLRFYNCGVKGLSLPNLPDNFLIAKDVSPRIHAGTAAPMVENLFRLLYTEVNENLPRNGEITHAVLMALIEILLYQLPHERQQPAREKDQLLIACKDYIERPFHGRIDGGSLSGTLAYERFGVCPSVQEILWLSAHPVHHPAAHRRGTDALDDVGPFHHGSQRARRLRQYQLFQQSVQAFCRNVAAELPQSKSRRAPVQETQSAGFKHP